MPEISRGSKNSGPGWNDYWRWRLLPDWFRCRLRLLGLTSSIIHRKRPTNPWVWLVRRSAARGCPQILPPPAEDPLPCSPPKNYSDILISFLTYRPGPVQLTNVYIEIGKPLLHDPQSWFNFPLMSLKQKSAPHSKRLDGWLMLTIQF